MNSDQPNLPFFDREEGIRRRDEALKRVGDHAKAEWKRQATDATIACARELNDFTTDEVWEKLNGTSAVTHEPKAMGHIMTEVAKLDFIEKTDQTRPSNRPVNHRRDVRIWLSKVNR